MAFHAAQFAMSGSRIPRTPARPLLLRGVLLLVLIVGLARPTDVVAQTPRVVAIHDFHGPPNGLQPNAAPVQARDGNFYGTTLSGGLYNDGTVYKLTPAGALTTLHSFDISDGEQPTQVIQGGDGNFYSITYVGGHNRDGTVFKVTPDGTFATLYDFGYSGPGSNPVGITQGKDGNFYGATLYGGPQGYGTVFKLTPDGVLTNLYSFTNAGGGKPSAGPVEGDDGNFYGTTTYAGTDYFGMVYKITSTGVFTLLHGFTFNSGDGLSGGTLIHGSDGNFYGITGGGGASDYGTVFKITPDGVETILHSFSGGAGYVGTPVGLTQGPDGNFYGATVGNNYEPSDGSIFRLTPDGVFTTVRTFTAGDGHLSAGVLQGSDGRLYATTSDGGIYTGGTAISLSPTDGKVSTLYNFNSIGNEGSSDGTVIRGADGNFYGTTSGGAYNKGLVFKLTRAGALTTLHDFRGGSEGGGPTGSLTQDADGNFYGTTSGGSGYGTVYKVSPDGMFTTLHIFNGSDGDNPSGLIKGGDGNFYGSTDGSAYVNGYYGYGTIYSVTPTGGFTLLHSFGYHVGGGTLTLGPDGNFFGVTRNGGTSGFGAVFSLTPTGGYTILHNFAGTGDGVFPVGSLALGADGNFYGTTAAYYDSGFTYQRYNGTVFKITPGGALTTLHTFSGNGDVGISPSGGLIAGSDGNFYGLIGAAYSYGSNGGGLAFRITPDGVVTPLSQTDSSGNTTPYNKLIQASDGSVYGAFSSTGLYGFGRVQVISAGPAVTSAASATAVVGQPFSFQIVADGSPTSYEASDLPPGLSIDTATGIISGLPARPGSYPVYVAADNLYGTGPALLLLTVSPSPVLAAPVLTSVTSASVQVGTAFAYQIAANNSPTGFGANSLPPGLSVNGTGLISGTPVQTGTFTINLSATNAGGTGTGTLALTVSPVPVAAPVITSAAMAAGQVGVGLSYQITASNAPTSFDATGLPTGLSVDPAGGLISGTPTQAGTFAVNLSASNDGGTGTALLTLSVAAAPVSAPVITSALAGSAQTGSAFTYQITADNSPTSFGASGLPPGLSVDSGSGLISGTATMAGTYSVALSATNAGGAGTGTGTGRGTLTLSIAPALPVVTLAASTPTVIAGSGERGEFTVSLSSAQDHDVIVNLTIKGSAVNGTDYVLLKTTKKFKAGRATKPIRIVPLGEGEGPGVKRVVTIVLAPGEGYTVGTTGKVRVKIFGQ